MILLFSISQNKASLEQRAISETITRLRELSLISKSDWIEDVRCRIKVVYGKIDNIGYVTFENGSTTPFYVKKFNPLSKEISNVEYKYERI